MQALKCELCGSTEIVKTADNLFQCQHCGCKYTLEQARSLVNGTVEVVQGNAYLNRALENARAKVALGDLQEAYTDLFNLSKDYAGECSVYIEMLDIYCKQLERGVRVTYKILEDVAILTSKAKKTAKDATQNSRIASCEAVFDRLIANYPTKKQIDVLDIFDNVIQARKNGVGIPSNKVLDFAVQECLNMLTSGEVTYQWPDLSVFLSAHPLIKKYADTVWAPAAENVNRGTYRFAEVNDDGGPKLSLLTGDFSPLDDYLVHVKYFLPTTLVYEHSVYYKSRNGNVATPINGGLESVAIRHFSINFAEMRKALDSASTIKYLCCPQCGLPTKFSALRNKYHCERCKKSYAPFTSRCLTDSFYTPQWSFKRYILNAR